MSSLADLAVIWIVALLTLAATGRYAVYRDRVRGVF